MRDRDDPASRVYPVTIPIIRGLHSALDLNDAELGTLNCHIVDLIIVAFFWLLRPAEYPASTEPEARTQAFQLSHVSITIGGTVYPAATAPLNDANVINRVTSAALTFADQKNAVRGELVGHPANNDPFFCPAKALTRIARRLRLANAAPTEPLYRHYNYHPHHRRWYSVTNKHVTNALRHSANALHSITGIDAKLLSARSLRPGGATALLCAGVDKDAIQLLGRWKSDAMFRYLRIQAAVYASNYAQLMLDHGTYTFTPQAFAAAQLPNEAPPQIAALLQHEELYAE